MPGSDMVVAYDATHRLSERHLVKRNGPHVAVCGERLDLRSTRYLDGLPTEHDSPHADCRKCLFERAVAFVRMFQGEMPAPLASKVNTVELPDEKIVILLGFLLATTAWGTSTLIAEHFPAELVERAVAS
jgi:hypothetical protein